MPPGELLTLHVRPLGSRDKGERQPHETHKTNSPSDSKVVVNFPLVDLSEWKHDSQPLERELKTLWQAENMARGRESEGGVKGWATLTRAHEGSSKGADTHRLDRDKSVFNSLVVNYTVKYWKMGCVVSLWHY